MKSISSLLSRSSGLLLAAASLALFCPSAAHAQAPVRATTTMHPDNSRTVTVVDPEKMTSEETTTDASGKITRKMTYLLDEQNQPMGAIAYDAKGNVMYRASYTRDGAGRIAEENITSPENVFMRRRVYTYGANNKVTNMTEYDAQGNLIYRPRTTNASQGRPDKKKR